MASLCRPCGSCLDAQTRQRADELSSFGVLHRQGTNFLVTKIHGATLCWRQHQKWKWSIGPPKPTAMTRSREDLAGKKVVVVGLGVSGRAAVKLALARGADVVAVDVSPSATPPEVDSAVASRLRVELGPHNRETFLSASQLVLSPGVPMAHSDVAFAVQAGVPAVSELSFAAEALPRSVKIGAVSGTNGKSTVTSFAGQLLRHAGVRTFVGGNFGVPLSEAVLQCMAFPEADPPFHAAVVEVSSYQMEAPGKFCPKVAVILNLTPDHLERHGTMETYGLMKCRLFAQMGSSSLAVVPQSDPLLRKLSAQSGHKGTRAWLGGLPGVQLDSQARRAFVMIPSTGAKAALYLSSLKAPGPHNAHNAGAAALIALALDVGLEEKDLQDAIPDLHSLPHRMEIVCRDEQEVMWVNDSKATNIEATMAGISALGGRQAVVLLGGLAKVVDRESLGFGGLVDVLNTQRAVILFGASGKSIEEELQAANIKAPCHRVECLKDAVAAARKLAKAGDVVILSPACASFDEFDNFEHRGQIFRDMSKRQDS